MHVNLKYVGRRQSAVIFAACLLGSCLELACRGGNSQSATPASIKEERPAPAESSSNQSATPTAVRGQLGTIVAFGDSLTAGVAGRTYPDDLQDLLQAHGYRYRVDNQGVGGDTTTDGLARIENVIEAHPDLVILEFGGNDGLRGTPLNAIRQNMEAMIRRLQKAHTPVVLLGITLPPNYGPEYVKPFTAMFPELAKEFKIPYIPFVLQHVYQNPELMQPDGIHPNGEGNKILAEDVYKLITPLLKR